MFPRNEVFTSEFATKHVGAGLAQGRVEAVLAVLEARGLTPTEAERTRISECADETQLKEWLKRAATAQSTSELFED